MASRIDIRRVDSRGSGSLRFLAFRNVARAHHRSGNGGLGASRKRFALCFHRHRAFATADHDQQSDSGRGSDAHAELAILTRQLKVKREFLHSWAGSSKRIKLSGTFNVKAGFDLRQDVAVDVHPNEILIQLPHAEIVGIEERNVDVLALENGLWNRITGADLQNELAQLPEMARRQAMEMDLPAEAEQELQRQLNKRIHARQALKLVFTNAPHIESPVTNQ